MDDEHAAAQLQPIAIEESASDRGCSGGQTNTHMHVCARVHVHAYAHFYTGRCPVRCPSSHVENKKGLLKADEITCWQACVCPCPQIRSYMWHHACPYTGLCRHVFTHVGAQTCIYDCAPMIACMFVRISLHLTIHYIHICTHVCTHACTHVCAHVCTHVYIQVYTTCICTCP